MKTIRRSQVVRTWNGHCRVGDIVTFDVLGQRLAARVSRKQPLAPLRTRGQRPCSDSPSKRDELASPHSITSSANICIDIGTSIPSALAAFMLMTSSNLVGCILLKQQLGTTFDHNGCCLLTYIPVKREPGYAC